MKKKFPLITLAVGLTALVAGGVFLAIKMSAKSQAAVADYLVQIGTWVEEGTDNSVIWNFTEIGKGTLTTNAHLNDYDFVWALENGSLKIETAWLYDLENEYTFELDQAAQKLTLTSPSNETFVFSPLTTALK